MKYIITGSTGHISKPLTQALIAAGHKVTVVTSRDDRSEEIKSIGATPAVGSIEDRDFLTRTFADADGVYLMIPPKADATDWLASQKLVADNYIAAVETNHIKYVVILSSIGANLRKGAGPVDGLGYLEEQLPKLTQSNVRILRPSSFYYNLFAQIGMIKNAGFIGSTQPSDFKLILVHPADIAAAAAKHLVAASFTGTAIEYVASDDTHTWAEITKILGTAIGKPDLNYVELTDEQSLNGMLQAGLPPAIANGYVEMNRSLREGKMQADYWANRPATLGKVKLEDFAKEFAGAFNAA